jgi:hypothetical protein
MSVLPFGETVTVAKPAWTTDRYGNIAPDWSNATVSTYDHCVAYPGTTDEVTDGRETGVEVGLTLLLPYGADVAAMDRVTWRGSVYEVVGEAYEWRSPLTGWQPGTEVPLRAFAG